MKLTIELELDNALFEEGGSAEISRVLAEAAERIPRHTKGDINLYDLAGNWIGYAKIHDERGKHG